MRTMLSRGCSLDLLSEFASESDQEYAARRKSAFAGCRRVEDLLSRRRHLHPDRRRFHLVEWRHLGLS